jgi:hypothetical protein
MMRRCPIIITFLFLVTAGMSAQDQANGVFAPFVSRIAAGVADGKVTLTWENSEDVNGYKQIYRAETEITENNLKNASLIARVGPEAASYVDTPPANRDYYYAVLLEDRNGDPYRVFIPYRNKTVAAVRLSETAAQATSAAAAVSGITASVTGDTVTVRFIPSNRTRELILYRSTAPLRSYADLAKAGYSILLGAGTDAVKDVPLPGVDYYYAVVDAALVNSGKVEFVPGQNSTPAPVQIPLGELPAAAQTPPERVYPLPAPHVLYSIETGEELLPPLPFLLPQEMKLADAVRERVDNLIARIAQPPTPMAFELLPVDEASNLEGEDLLLQTIAKAAVAAPDAKETADKFSEFLQTSHGDKAEARARFYLGQSYFLHGQTREALLQFVFAQSQYYVETQKWINACLETLSAAN